MVRLRAFAFCSLSLATHFVARVAPGASNDAPTIPSTRDALVLKGGPDVTMTAQGSSFARQLHAAGFNETPLLFGWLVGAEWRRLATDWIAVGVEVDGRFHHDTAGVTQTHARWNEFTALATTTLAFRDGDGEYFVRFGVGFEVDYGLEDVPSIGPQSLTSFGWTFSFLPRFEVRW